MSTVRAILEHAEAERLEQTAPPRHRAKLFQDKQLPPLKLLELVDWFFNEGQTRFEKSVTGAIIEQARLGSYTSRRCERCDGSGVLGDYQDMLTADAKWRKDDKKPIMSRVEELFGTCPDCNGRGSKETRSKAHRQQYSKVAPFEPIDELTVRPSKKQEHGAKSPPDDTDLTRYAICSRMLSFLSQHHRAVMGLAFGPYGKSWSETIKGREWAVIPLTSEGARLLACDGMPDDKRAPSLLDEIGELAKLGKLSAENSKLLKQAIKSARKELEATIEAWNKLLEGIQS